MTPQTLRERIYSRAFEGQLVDHCPTEGTAEDTLSCIKYQNVNSVDECPDIPETWRWTYLIDMADILYGFPFNSEKFNEACIGMPIIRIRDINNGYSKTFSDEPCEERYRITEGDMLVGMDGNFQVAFWKSEDAWLNQRVCKITSNPQVLVQKYLYYYLPLILKEINGTVSFSTVKHLSAKILNKMLIPLPPLAEQKRIVAKIEELLPYVDRYEKAWGKLEDFNKRFPVDMQKSILQMAIQGKLVDQRPEEGSGEELFQQIQAEKQRLTKAGTIKKEKPLPEIAEDEIPYEIPANWTWVRFGELGSYKKGPFGSALTKSMFVPKGNGAIKVYEQKNAIQKDASLGEYYITKEYFESKMRGFEVFPGDIIVSCAGTIGETYVMPNEFEQGIINQALMRMKIFEPLYIPYFLVFFDFVLKKNAQSSSKGSAIKNIPPFEVLKNYLVPLPPLAEQERIVAKLEEILPLCDRLK